MNHELMGASAALVSLIALAQWAQATPTRAWGDGTQGSARARAWAIALAILALQTVTAVAAAGPAAGVALVLAAWMGLGWLLVLGMNQWPQATQRWASRLGAVGGLGCVAGLGWMLVRG